MLPREKELVKRLKDQRFALIGINSDVPDDRSLARKPFAEKLETVRKHVKTEVLEKNGITWRNAIECGTDGPLPTRWNVSGWPTLYVVDAAGVIRYKGHDDREMEKVVDACLAELASTAPAKK